MIFRGTILEGMCRENSSSPWTISLQRVASRTIFSTWVRSGAPGLQVLQEQVAVNQDAPQGIVDFMGHPRGQLSQGRQLFRAAQMLLQVLLVGDVPDMGLDGGLAFVGGGERDPLQVEFAAVLFDPLHLKDPGRWSAGAVIASATGPPPGGTGGPQTGGETGSASRSGSW